MSNAELNSQSYNRTVNSKKVINNPVLTTDDVGLGKLVVDGDIGGVTFQPETWFLLAEVTMPQSASTVRLMFYGAGGFNVGRFSQCSKSEVIIRSGNNSPKGITVAVHDDMSILFKDCRWQNTTGDTYCIYVQSSSRYTNGIFMEYNCSNNASVNDHWKAISGGLPSDTTPAFFIGRRHPLTLLNGWTNYGGEYEIATYSIKGSIVSLGGLIKNNAKNTGIATLPEFYRPQNRVMFLVVCNGGYRRVDVYPHGAIIVNAAGGSEAAEYQGFLSLEGISFNIL